MQCLIMAFKHRGLRQTPSPTCFLLWRFGIIEILRRMGQRQPSIKGGRMINSTSTIEISLEARCIGFFSRNVVSFPEASMLKRFWTPCSVAVRNATFFLVMLVPIRLKMKFYWSRSVIALNIIYHQAKGRCLLPTFLIVRTLHAFVCFLSGGEAKPTT